ncbi:hypothetical protein RhiTH_008967 [Rhizoctonia solani]
MDQQSCQAQMEQSTHPEWKRYCSPTEGRPYYWIPDLNVFTESDITKEHVLRRIGQCAQEILSALQGSNKSDYDIVLKVPETREGGWHLQLLSRRS